MSNLLNELTDIATRPAVLKSVCNTAYVLAQLSEEEATAALALIDNPRISTARIATALQNNGHRVGDDSILRHRKRGTGAGCRCPR